MIVDMLEHADFYYALDVGLKAGLEFIKRSDLSNFPDGKHPIIDESVYLTLQRYQTRPASTNSWEAHRRFIDIQLLLEGEEMVGFAPLERLTVGVYDHDRDLQSLIGTGEFLRLIPGIFMILFPHDAHQPCITAGTTPITVRKAVVKVALMRLPRMVWSGF